MSAKRRNLTDRFSFRVSSTLDEELRRIAAAEGASVAEWIRAALRTAVMESWTPTAEARESRPASYHVRLGDPLAQRIRERAADAGVSVSQWIRGGITAAAVRARGPSK